MSKEFDNILNNSLEMLQRGSRLEDCLSAFPRYAEKLRPLLMAANVLQRWQVPQPSPQALSRGEEALLQVIGSEAPSHSGFMLPSLVPFAAAAVVAVIALMAVALGGPLRDAFNLDTNVAVADGTVATISNGTLQVTTQDGATSVVINANTQIESLDGVPLDITVIAPGLDVRVSGVNQQNGAILARKIVVKIEIEVDGVEQEVKIKIEDQGQGANVEVKNEDDPEDDDDHDNSGQGNNNSSSGNSQGEHRGRD